MWKHKWSRYKVHGERCVKCPMTIGLIVNNVECVKVYKIDATYSKADKIHMPSKLGFVDNFKVNTLEMALLCTGIQITSSTTKSLYEKGNKFVPIKLDWSVNGAEKGK